jgi:monoamine oxidase
MRLAGVRVGVAGAGLAGLAAARALEQAGADVHVFEARNRVGGRVWTLRDGFGGQHAEAGADLIESEHTALLELARELGLRPTPILPGGFHHYGLDRTGRTTVQPLMAAADAIEAQIGTLVREYRLAEQRWDGPIAARLGARSVAAWLDACGAEPWVLDRMRGLRNLFLADPEDLSMLSLVDFFADDPFRSGRTLRLRGGNDRLAARLAESLARRPALGAVIRGVRQSERRVTLTVESDGRRAEFAADFAVLAVPATTARDVVFEPALPDAQHEAIAGLPYGPATRLLLQFRRPFWRRVGRPRAFGTALPIGAVWDGSEEQRGPAAILTLLAGGRASRALQEIVRRDGAEGVVRMLGWIGKPSPLAASRLVSWENDPWACGGYAVFGPGVEPRRREWLARPAGRVVFAGEHTSLRWQGYMNGAIESGRRAAAEVAALYAP